MSHSTSTESTVRVTRTAVNWKRLWAGGVATAIVAALAGVVGVLAVRGPIDTPVISPPHTPWDSQVTTVAVYAAIAALIATGLLHLLLISTPRASTFFTWIGILATAAFALWPFSVDATAKSQIASGAIYLVVGIAIVSLLSGVAASAQSTFTARP
ncbi:MULTISPECIES: DUF6069 family protein [Prescottella]|uniref:DUF6069 family protein n=1 Tax=Prescottella TaxID=2979332 RepID=UPI0007CD7D20|nr:DUF6069 family protein [Prescottella equi]GBF16996.1 hypothetical protein Br6_04399 [Rhodococcus sp. Br-6]MBM4468664.1 hypothetical protein [Prescottella equi]MBM4634666.1 hypothetical protein [Prescottella equi]NKR51505.1 hypothetical protein [Prescottella equi]NKR63379.1 hypothetical protein [Prescottella equi]